MCCFTPDLRVQLYEETQNTDLQRKSVELNVDKNKTCRFYMSQDELTEELRTLARYIIAVYVPAVLGIKT